MESKIRRHTDLIVYQRAYTAAMTLFETTKSFPIEERYSLIDQVRRSSRSVCANLAEAWQKRRYKGAFIAKLCDSEAEAAETQVWIQFAVDSKYVDREIVKPIYNEYDEIIAMLVTMINNPDKWILFQ
ncbi:MAG: four helix bundle protein [Planctomycetota bacterium]|nr:four helix bundle protein [Planctomycetota bacterium]MDA1212632.1 four helix bundle protein [Planctomycetota bacterium]